MFNNFLFGYKASTKNGTLNNHFYSLLAIIAFSVIAGSSIDESDINFAKWVIIISLIIGISIPIIKFFLGQQKIKSIQNIDDFNIDDSVASVDGSSAIAIDKTNREIAFKNNSIQLIIKYEDLINVELLENGSSIQKKSTGRTIGGVITGGVILGPIGAIVGGLSGKSKTINKSNSISLKIIINDLEAPVHYIIFLDTETKMDDFAYKNARKKAELWHAKLSAIISLVDSSNNVSISNQNQSVADEIKKLNDLLKNGVLTQSEFEIQKDKLLNR